MYHNLSYSFHTIVSRCLFPSQTQPGYKALFTSLLTTFLISIFTPTTVMLQFKFACVPLFACSTRESLGLSDVILMTTSTLHLLITRWRCYTFIFNTIQIPLGTLVSPVVTNPYVVVPLLKPLWRPKHQNWYICIYMVDG